jgi:hypothetical protein
MNAKSPLAASAAAASMSLAPGKEGSTRDFVARTIIDTAAYVQAREAEMIGSIASAVAGNVAREAAITGAIISSGRRAAEAVATAAADRVAEAVAPPLSVIITGKRAMDALAAKAASGVATTAALEVKAVTDAVRRNAAAANTAASGVAAALASRAVAARNDLADSAAVTGRLLGIDAKLEAIGALAGAVVRDMTRRSNMAQQAAHAALSQGGASILSAAKGVDRRQAQVLQQFVPLPVRAVVQRVAGTFEGSNGRGLPGAMGRAIANKVFQGTDVTHSFGLP